MSSSSKYDRAYTPAGRNYYPDDYPPLTKADQSRYRELAEMDRDYKPSNYTSKRSSMYPNYQKSTSVRAPSSDPAMSLNLKKSVRTSMMNDHLKAEMCKTDSKIADYAKLQLERLHRHVRSIEGEGSEAYEKWKREKHKEHGLSGGHEGSGNHGHEERDPGDGGYRGNSAKRHDYELEEGEIPPSHHRG